MPHVVQTAAPLLEPVLAPAVHVRQRVAPAADEYVPVAHGTHVETDEAPSTSLDVPGSHATHALIVDAPVAPL